MQSHCCVASTGESETKEESSAKTVQQADETPCPRHTVRWNELAKEGEVRANRLASFDEEQHRHGPDYAAPNGSYTGAERYCIKLGKRLAEDLSRRRVGKAQRAVTKAEATVDVVSESPG